MRAIEANSRLSDYLSRLHDESEAEIYANARAQFKGTDDEFLILAKQYTDLAPEKKGTF